MKYAVVSQAPQYAVSDRFDHNFRTRPLTMGGGRGKLLNTMFNADFLIVPVVLENKRCAGYYHRNRLILSAALPNLSEFES